ncbi:hypothetical protein BDZ94DRAFT_1288192 [Collybia nuda]|uniref:Histone acetyltransferase n=1 Tax=Collybia nuda TaxID=64659 RepID=A0A9P5YF98_9AGAR|nr:hypothetical protein BDZ94DRAFT_1288192 [Collybia nuda]
MRGLPFPTNVAFDRETSNEYGTPINNVGAIPIDPALVGPAIDPTLMEEGARAGTNDTQPETQHSRRSLARQDQYTHVQQYSEGPQGDPFAPQATHAYFPVEAELPPPPTKPAKRKRRARREEECGFCQGNDSKNKEGRPETMVTCTECGRSGHPSCMELTHVSHELLRTYPWKCLECKNCEICHEKGDDERILFCDFCDRGWHMYCLIPPLQEPPTGKWHCPSCPPLQLQLHYVSQPGYCPPPEHTKTLPDTPQPRASSVASSSRSLAHLLRSDVKSMAKGKGKGKAKAITTDESEEDPDVSVEDHPKVARIRGRPKQNRKPTIPKEVHYTDEEVPALSPPRHSKRARVREESPIGAPLPRVRLRLPSHKAKGKEREREEDDRKGVFDDILTPEERDTTKTSITNMDKQRFERSRMLAEQKFTPAPAPAPPILSRMSEIPEIPSTPGPSRPLRSSTTLHHFPAISTINPLGLSASPAPSTPGPASKTDLQALRIRTIRFGLYDIKTWYDAPFPEEYASIPDGRLFICEFCLKYMKSWFAVERHRVKCKMRHPPGDEIYRDGTVSIFEVDGRKNKIYCQNLCLLSKMFLDHKSLFYDVEPFLFYVMTETDEIGARFVGYFSKEKRSPKDYNVSCIMTLPVRQRQGWGNLLIDFSYLLSKKEQRPGSPEKPLSNLGALGYRNYWTLSLMRYLQTAPKKPRLEDISLATSMTIEDIYNTLLQQSMISARDPTPPPIKPIPGQSIKFPKGRKNGIARKNVQRTQTNDKEVDTPKGPFVAPTHYEIHWDPGMVDNYMRTWEAKGYFKLKPEKLSWSPYLLTRARVGKEKEHEVAAAEGSGATSSVEATDRGVNGTSNGNDNTSNADSSSLNTFQSPLGIFDDEIVDEVLRVSPAKTKTKSQSQKNPAQEVVQPDTDQAPKADTPPEPEKSSQKHLRSRSNQPSTISTPKRTSILVVEEPRTTRAGRKSPTKSHLVDGDEALAAKLALEEQMQGRILRPRSSGIDLKRTTSPHTAATPPRTMPPRKRQRLNSPPEAGETPLSMIRSESPVLINGNLPNGKALDLEASKLAATLFADEVVPIITPMIPLVHEDRRSGTIEELGKIGAAVTNNKDGPEDVKSEDPGTPFTTMTSRQSLPSEVTVVTIDTEHKNDPAPAVVAVELASPTEPTLRTSEAEASTNEPSISIGIETEGDVDADADTDVDADADGEYEEDAEGEVDGDGEMGVEEGTS